MNHSRIIVISLHLKQMIHFASIYLFQYGEELFYFAELMKNKKISKLKLLNDLTYSQGNNEIVCFYLAFASGVKRQYSLARPKIVETWPLASMVSNDLFNAVFNNALDPGIVYIFTAILFCLYCCFCFCLWMV